MRGDPHEADMQAVAQRDRGGAAGADLLASVCTTEGGADDARVAGGYPDADAVSLGAANDRASEQEWQVHKRASLEFFVVTYVYLAFARNDFVLSVIFRQENH